MIARLARQISFFAPSAVMSAWAVVMLHTIASGHINRLLSPMFRSYVLTAAIVLLVLSLLHLVLYDAPPLTAPGSRWRQMVRWLVLMVPVIAASILSPAALSSTTFSNRALSSTAGVTPMPTWANASSSSVQAVMSADPSQPVPVDVMDLVTLSRTPAKAQDFTGRKVRMVGFLVHPAGGGAPKLLRWMMWCCAADAQPVSVTLSGNTAGDFKETQWIEIVGTAKFPSTLGQATPAVEVDSIKETTEPDEPYLSP
jgi:uncharacterized repeat protein (TIGR03943 family)